MTALMILIGVLVGIAIVFLIIKPKDDFGFLEWSDEEKCPLSGKPLYVCDKYKKEE